MLSIITFLLAALLLFIVTRPDEFFVERTTTIDASVDDVFFQINDLQAWNAWSPWAKLDPNAKTSFSGPQAGVGASMAWDGNGKIGAGSMTIVETKVNEYIRIRLDFLRPMKATNMSEFNLEAVDQGTRLTWNMSGQNTFLGKAISLVFNCDKMVGGMYEKGFYNLKKVLKPQE